MESADHWETQSAIFRSILRLPCSGVAISKLFFEWYLTDPCFLTFPAQQVGPWPAQQMDKGILKTLAFRKLRHGRSVFGRQELKKQC